VNTCSCYGPKIAGFALEDCPSKEHRRTHKDGTPHLPLRRQVAAQSLKSAQVSDSYLALSWQSVGGLFRSKSRK